tara:strand:+ start:321 stop:827 length:507 start_codon:yes stop_codon:yes gene_type:complete
MVTWKKQPLGDYDSVWEAFTGRFQFKPSTTQWPGFAEPADSRTYAIGHVYGDPDRYAHLTLDLCTKLVRALRRCIPVGDYVDVLDWQHESFRFWPHEPFEFAAEDDWPIPVLPNGDYYIFVARDFELGVLGHPWEQTICTFGSPLLEAFSQDPPELFDRAIRVGGRTV